MIRPKSQWVFYRRARPYIRGIISGLITLLILLCLCGGIFTLIQGDEAKAVITGRVILIAACLVAGIFTGGAKGKNGFIAGTFSAVIIFTLCLISSLITGGFTGESIILKLILCPVAGCIGGIIGVNIIKERY